MAGGKVFEKLAALPQVASIQFTDAGAEITLMAGWKNGEATTFTSATAHAARLWIQAAHGPNGTPQTRARRTRIETTLDGEVIEIAAFDRTQYRLSTLDIPVTRDRCGVIDKGYNYNTEAGKAAARADWPREANPYGDSSAGKEFLAAYDRELPVLARERAVEAAMEEVRRLEQPQEDLAQAA